jgi:hypothetical protein
MGLNRPGEEYNPLGGSLLVAGTFRAPFDTTRGIMQKATKATAAFLSITLFVSTGCATILKGTSDKVDFNSVPTGAKVYLNGSYSGNTPTEIKLNSARSYQIEFQKEGYETRGLVLSNSIGVGWVILDIIFGLIPVVVDAATGSWYYLDTNQLSASLEKK